MSLSLVIPIVIHSSIALIVSTEGLALLFCAVPSDQIPQELQDVCEQLGYHLSSSMHLYLLFTSKFSYHIVAQPVEHAERMPDNPAPEEQDAESVTSTLTKWEHFSTGAMPPLKSSSSPLSCMPTNIGF